MISSCCRLDFSAFRMVIQSTVQYTIEPIYNGIDLYDTSSIPPDILRYQLIPHC